MSIINSDYQPIPLFLDVDQRPQEIADAISSAFENVRKDNYSNWGCFNGEPSYDIVSIKERKLLKTLILQAPADRKDFYFLDIGAGDFLCSKHVAAYINKQKDIKEYIRVHIIGIRGEQYFGERKVIDDKCIIYQLGAFKIEDVMSQLQKEGLFLRNSIDVIVSRWTFRHLIDPVGTFIQTYDLLRPETGCVLMDGFFYVIDDNAMARDFDNLNKTMANLLLLTKARFLMQYWKDASSLNRFILRKPDDFLCELPLSYRKIEEIGDKWASRSQKITRFNRTAPSLEPVIVLPCPNGFVSLFSGDLSLYLWLKQNDLFPTRKNWWDEIPQWQGPILEGSSEYAHYFPAHDAIIRGDLTALEEMLNNELDVNSQDQDGSTLIKVALKINNDSTQAIIQCLVDRGAILPNENGVVA